MSPSHGDISHCHIVKCSLLLTTDLQRGMTGSVVSPSSTKSLLLGRGGFWEWDEQAPASPSLRPAVMPWLWPVLDPLQGAEGRCSPQVLQLCNGTECHPLSFPAQRCSQNAQAPGLLGRMSSLVLNLSADSLGSRACGRLGRERGSQLEASPEHAPHPAYPPAFPVLTVC